MTEKIQRCVVYTRKSSENGLEQEFNRVRAQYEACAYALSQCLGDHPVHWLSEELRDQI